MIDFIDLKTQHFFGDNFQLGQQDGRLKGIDYAEV